MTPPDDPAFAGPPPEDGPKPLFPGDTGTLTAEAREALVTLIKRPYLWSEEHPDQWAALRVYEADLRSACHNMYVDLKVDRRREIAYKTPAAADADDPLPSLLRQDTWLREDTIVLLQLRRLLESADTADGRVIVDREDLLEQAMEAEPEKTADRAQARSRYGKAIDRMSSNRLLVSQRLAEGRFVISPMVEVLLDKERLDRMTAALDGDAEERAAR